MNINCKHDSQSQYMYVTHGPPKRYVYYIGYMWIYTVFVRKTWASQDIYAYKKYVYYIGCMWTHGVPQDMCVLRVCVYYMYVCLTYVYHIGCMQTHRVPQSMCVWHICVYDIYVCIIYMCVLHICLWLINFARYICVDHILQHVFNMCLTLSLSFSAKEPYN